jgi:hypothetical protein
MKTNITLFTVLTLSAFSISAGQVTRSFGFKLGPVRAEQQWQYASQLSGLASGINPIWGLDAATFVEISFTQNLGLLAELHYVQKGRLIKTVATAPANDPYGYVDLGPVEIKERFHYLSAATLAEFKIASRVVTPFVALGPRIEYLLSHPGLAAFDQFNKVALGGIVGAGVEVSPGFSPGFLVEIVYDASLTHTFKNDFVTVDNRSLSLLVGVFF